MTDLAVEVTTDDTQTRTTAACLGHAGPALPENGRLCLEENTSPEIDPDATARA